MTIKTGDTIEVTQVLQAIADSFRVAITNLWELDENTLDTVASTDYKKTYFGTNGTDNIDEATSTAFTDGLDAANDVVYCATTIDECADSSLNTDIWTAAGTVTEPAGGYIRLTMDTDVEATSSIIADGSSALNHITGDWDKCFYTKIVSTTPGAGAAMDTTVQISNGSTHVTLYTFATAEADTDTAFIKVLIDDSASEAYVYVNGTVTVGSPVDISSVTTNWYFRLTATSDGNNATCYSDLYYLRAIYGAETSLIMYTDEHTASVTTREAVMFAKTSGIGTYAYACSANSGSNYTDTFTEGTFKVIANTGTGIIGRITMTEPATGSITSVDPPYVKAWGIQYHGSEY